MKTKIFNSNLGLLLTVVGSMLLCVAAKADDNSPLAITPGSQIQFLGTATLDGPIATATAFQSITGVQGSANPNEPVTQNASGSYLPVPNGTPVQFTPFVFGGAHPTNNFTLWSFTSSGILYSFFITSISNVFQIGTPGGGGFLDLMGTGVATIGSDQALANWTITDTTGGSPVVTFSASFNSLTPVPEPSTYALLAVAAVLFVAFRYFSGKYAAARIKQR